MIHQILSYNPTTGKFSWKRPGSGRRFWIEPGSIDSTGYRKIRIGNKLYAASRLAWFLTYGKWPQGEIDHINGVRDDNRIDNLREATRQENQRNRRGELKGVTKHGNRFRARITISPTKRVHLGVFSSEQEALDAYAMAAREFFGEFARVE